MIKNYETKDVTLHEKTENFFTHFYPTPTSGQCFCTIVLYE